MQRPMTDALRDVRTEIETPSLTPIGVFRRHWGSLIIARSGSDSSLTSPPYLILNTKKHNTNEELMGEE